MRAIPIQLLLLLFVTFSVSAAEKKKAFSVTEQEEMMEHVSGAFDMSRNPRPYIVYMILDQQGSRHPSFWCGKNVEGKVGFKGQLDVLDEKIHVTQNGAFTVQITNAARKYGMFDTIPGGVWAQKFAALNFRIIFETFSEVALQGLTQFKGDRSIAGN
jgi:hypothetical protein